MTTADVRLIQGMYGSVRQLLYRLRADAADKT
jgi:hypothetical protein